MKGFRKGLTFHVRRLKTDFTGTKRSLQRPHINLDFILYCTVLATPARVCCESKGQVFSPVEQQSNDLQWWTGCLLVNRPLIHGGAQHSRAARGKGQGTVCRSFVILQTWTPKIKNIQKPLENTSGFKFFNFSCSLVWYILICQVEQQTKTGYVATEIHMVWCEHKRRLQVWSNVGWWFLKPLVLGPWEIPTRYRIILRIFVQAIWGRIGAINIQLNFPEVKRHHWEEFNVFFSVLWQPSSFFNRPTFPPLGSGLMLCGKKLNLPEVIQHHWREIGPCFLYYDISNMFLLNLPASAILIPRPTLSQPWILFSEFYFLGRSLNPNQAVWMVWNSREMIHLQKGAVFFPVTRNRSFLSGFRRFPKAFINFSMVFIYFPWFSVISPRCPSISSWASMGSFMFIDVSLVFINFCKVFIDFLLAFRFFMYFSMMFIDVQWFSSISPRFSLFFPIMFITTIHVFHQWFHGAHGCSFYMSMVFIDFSWVSFIFLWFAVIFQRCSLSLWWVFIDVSSVFIYVFIVYRFCTSLLQWFSLIFMCSMVWSL